MTLHCTENLAVSVSLWKRTRVVYIAVCHANHLAITADITYNSYRYIIYAGANPPANHNFLSYHKVNDLKDIQQ